MQAQAAPPNTSPPSQIPADAHTFMMDVAPPPPPRESLANVIVGSLGLTGALVLAAVVSGGVLAGLWITWRKWRRTYDTDAPPSLGPMPLDPTTRPPSSPDQ